MNDTQGSSASLKSKPFVVLKMKVINKLSKIIGPLPKASVNKQFVSLSQKLFTETGLTHFNDGVGTLMPLLVKSLRKLEAIVRRQMKEVSAFEFMLPVLTQPKLFEISGRKNLVDIFRMDVDENKSYILSPTCEETAAYILSSLTSLSHKSFPIRLYQIGAKFRNEKRARSGLLRAREFLMKDLYCFDSDELSSDQCYEEVINQYHNFFQNLQVPYICAEGLTGDIGGLKSHEFHFLSEAGQDKIIVCQDCGNAENSALIESTKNSCQKCHSNNITIKNGIEVGQAFKLGTTFTKPFNITYINNENKKQVVHMSSYGLGLTRILAASVEVLSTSDQIRWPLALAPYLVCIIPPKAGSKEEKVAKDLAYIIYNDLNQFLEDDVIFDDRTSLTVGNKLIMDKKLGFPFQIVIGKSICDDPQTVEVIDVNTGSLNFVQVPDINQFILDRVLKVSDQTSREKVSL